MTSLWKDLLFLHGYLVHKEDLDPPAKAQADRTQHKDLAQTRDDAKAKHHTLACCAIVWPRIVVPH